VSKLPYYNVMDEKKLVSEVIFCRKQLFSFVEFAKNAKRKCNKLRLKHVTSFTDWFYPSKILKNKL